MTETVMQEKVAEAAVAVKVVAAMKPSAPVEAAGPMVICEAPSLTEEALMEMKEAEWEQRMGSAAQAVMSVLTRKGVAAEQAMEVTTVVEAVVSVVLVRMDREEVAPMATEAATSVDKAAVWSDMVDTKKSETEVAALAMASGTA